MSFGEVFRFFWKESRPYALQRNLGIASVATTVVIGFAGPLVVAQIIDIIQAGNINDSSRLWTLAIIYGATQVWAEIIGWRLSLYFIWKFETGLQRDLYINIFQKLTNETMFFHANKFGGSLVSQTNKLTSAAERFWDTIIWSATPLVLSLTIAITVLSTLLWQYAVFMLVFSIAFVVLVYFGARRMTKLNAAEAEASNQVSGHVADAISNILAVKSAGHESAEADNFKITTNNWRESSLNIMREFLLLSTTYSSISTAIRVAAIIFAILAAQNSTISVSAIYIIMTYTALIARELWNINGIMRNTNRVIGDASAMIKILNTPTSVTDKSNQEIKITKGRINIKNLTYTHDEGKGTTLFKDFNLTVKKGEKVGLVGTSGSGKTTLTKLLLRFADIDSGSIKIDGQDISDVTQQSLRSQIAYVPQEPLLFHRSISENIAYGKPNVTQAEIETAAKKAGAYDFIVGLKDGFDTLVGERGIRLSGGQRQRIAIARAILKDAPILILDEATSALDSESEAIIQKSLAELMKGRTSIVIAHRLSTISNLDRIVVMKNGAIIEDGSHEELLRHPQGSYARLWKRQSGGFIEE